MMEKDALGVVMAPFGWGQSKRGVEKGPSALVGAGLLERLSRNPSLRIQLRELALPVTVQDLDDEDGDSTQGMRNPQRVDAAAHAVARQVENFATQGLTTLTLGGDCSIKLGSIGGMAKAMKSRSSDTQVGVIYVDAHADLNTPSTSPSGNLHGMALAFLTGRARPPKGGVFQWLTNDHLIATGKLVYIGLRDVDEAEQQHINDSNIKMFNMRQIQSYGIEAVMNEALEHIGEHAPIQLSWDIDSMDMKHAPSTGYPTEPGLSMEQGLYIARRICGTKRLVGIDLTEINPAVGDEIEVKRTLETGMQIITAALAT